MRKVDFFVQEKVMVELKAVSILDDLHLAQAMNYLEALNLPVGLWYLKGCTIRNIPTMLATKISYQSPKIH